MPTPKFIFVSEVLQQLKDDHFEISEKSLDKLIRKYKIPSFKIDGRVCLNFEDYRSRSDSIKEELARLDALAKQNISKGQLKNKAIMRGILKCIANADSLKNKLPLEPFITFINNEFANKQDLYGQPPANAGELVEYVKGLLRAYDKSNKIAQQQNSKGDQNETPLDALTSEEIKALKEVLAGAGKRSETPPLDQLTPDELTRIRKALADQLEEQEEDGNKEKQSDSPS